MTNTIYATDAADAEQREVPRYAWPGGYALLYVDELGAVLCPDCVNELDPSDEFHQFVNWEGPDLECEQCNRALPSEYGGED